MPATLVLSGVISPRTYASSVTCSIRPPSQEFQFQLIVAKMAAASNTTNPGTTNFFHFGWGFGCSGTCSGPTAWAGAGVLAAAIVKTPLCVLLAECLKAL